MKTSFDGGDCSGGGNDDDASGGSDGNGGEIWYMCINILRFKLYCIIIWTR